ncbi:MAG TPA: pyridoxal phosphate-dependent aminotransferase [Candidatus Dormibacteraeota bacterium]|nr:pyridoxal phosphate-dependent aminotransferase [Candidatus Dormibacteraeota bacterium]
MNHESFGYSDLFRVSRRTFVRTAAIASAGALASITTEADLAYAQRRTARAIPDDAVLINANENPLGPCAEACSAMAAVAPKGGRYKFELTQELIKTFADIEGLKPEYIRAYAGSSEPLHYTVLAFTSPEKSLVMGDPAYEAPTRAAAYSGAKIRKVPLTKNYAHDVKAMSAADPSAGIVYICNPNNPTGTITSREDIEYALANKPKGAILLVDEAYIHFSDATPCLDLVAADKEIVVLRTFSKIYGMAGLRCGFAIARPDLLAKLDPYGWNSMPVTAVVAATCSLKTKTLVPARKKINADTRNDVFSWLSANKYSFVPSQSNCWMVDVNRPGHQFIDAMEKKNIYIGRVWPAWPTHVRVTVGTPAEMELFKKAFKEAMESPQQAASMGAPEQRLRQDRPYPSLS